MDRKWWTLIVVCAATFMLLLDITIVIVAIPEIQSGLHASFSDLQWVIDAYALTLASLLLTGGSLADRFGHRRLFVIGLSVFTLGSLLCGLAQSPLMLTLSRSFQGIGGAILFASSLALLAQSFRGKDRGVAFGVWGAITGVAVAAGPILGGVITSELSWRYIFFVNVPVGALAIIVSEWKVEESVLSQTSRPDWLGFLILTVSLVSLVYGLIRESETSWSNTGVIACLVGAVALAAIFLTTQLRVPHPMFDLRLLRVPTFTGGLIAAFCMNGSLFAMLLYLVLYLQDDLGYSALATGARLIILSGGTLVAATISGRLSSHVPVRWLIGPGLALVALGLLLMSGVSATSTWTHLVPGFILAGLGAGMVNPPLASTAVGVVTPDRSGMASGVNATFRQIGIAVGIALYGTIFTASLRNELGHTLKSLPGLSGNVAHAITEIKQGDVSQLVRAAPPSLRGELVGALHTSFTGSLNDLLVASAALALVGALCSVVLLRPKDFVHAPAREPSASHV